MKISFKRLLAAAAVLLAVAQGQFAHAGSVGRLYYDNLSTSSSLNSFRIGLASLTNAARFPHSASFREQLDDFTALPGSPLRAGLQGKDNSGNDFGSWIRGYLEAPETGAYLFNIASDDNSALLLSTNHLAEGKRLIAFETESGAPLFGGPRQDQRLSAPINLVRGQKYYFEVLHKQGGGGSYIQVGWQRPDGVQEVIPALHLAQFPVDPFLGTGETNQIPVFNTRGLNAGNLPTAVSVAEGSELLLQLDVIAAQPTGIQWKRNGVVIPGENLSFYRIARASASLNGATISAQVTNAFGTLTTATAVISVTPDTTAPSVLAVETGGNPNLLRVTFSEPVTPATATNLANYEVRVVGGGVLALQSATLTPGQQTVEFAGTFNFQQGVNYQLTTRNIQDQAGTPNLLSPNPTITGFTFSAPTGTTYTFNAGRPSGFRFFGNAEVVASGSYDDSGFLQLTDSFRNRNSAVLLTDRRDVDQVRIRFKTRISDGSSTTFDQIPGDGLSVNIAGDLPLGTLGAPEEGFTPDVPGNRVSFTFDTHPDSSIDAPSIAVLFNNQVLTNIIVGTNGVPLNGVPSLTSVDGRWAEVDIDLRRNGLLTLKFDGVTVINQLATPFEVINNAQIGIAARTRTWFQTHWIDDLNINYGEGDIGNVGLSPDSVLGGVFPEGSEVRLVALPVGAGPFTYQWFKNGNLLDVETNRVLRFAGTTSAGGQFSVRVRNAFSEFTSTPQTVTIQPDITAPQVVSVRGLAGGVNRIYLVFNETLDPVSATDVANYTSPLFRVSSAVLSVDGKSVTLSTTAQRVGITYPLNISGVRDRSVNAISLTTEVSFTSYITYQEEILADNPHRYFRFDETAGTVAFTDTASSDRANTNGTYLNLPILGVTSLVPSATNGYAVQLVGANTNYITVPNGGDINDYRGPWSQKTIEFWFRANSVPPVGATSLPRNTAGLYEEGGNQRSIHLHLWRDPANTNPNESELIFHAFNDGPDGPGAPFGLRALPPVYVRHTIQAATTYHVIGVFDGRTDSQDGELRLYLNGELVVRSTNGIGQIYNHNGDVRIGSGNARTFFDISAAFGSLDGVIDDLSLYNSVLSEERIQAHYRAGIGASLSATNPPTLVESVDPNGHPNQVNVVFNQPVSPATANNPANYTLKTAGGAVIAIQSAVLQDDLITVRLSGALNFTSGASYNLTVQHVADILAPENVVAPTTVPFTFVTAGPVGIGAASDLGNKIVTENDQVQFSVVATGQSPYRYQWFYQNTLIPGETNAVLSFIAELSSEGNYTVTVSNEFSSVTSGIAKLTVAPDTQAPRLLEVRGLAGSLNEVQLFFAEPVDPATATSVATYNIPGLSVSEAIIGEDGRWVIVKTSAQNNGDSHQITISGLKDRAASPNALTTTASFVSAVSYRDEVLAEGAVRYWPFNETSGTRFNTLVSLFDTAPENLIGTILNSPTLGVPSLVPNLPDDTAIAFSSLSTNRILTPNARDINAILGPWAKRTHLFTFRADSLPRITNGTNIASPAIYGHDRIGIYLYATQDTNNPTEALLVFTAHNNVSEGPGTPWGALSGNPETAKYVSVPVKAGQVYHVAAVLDGSSTSFTGQLRLYVNGAPVGFASGIGQIYKHPNTQPTFGHASFLRHDGVSQSLTDTSVNFNARLNGVIDEFAIIDRALSPARVAELYNYTQIVPPETGGGEAPEFTSIQVIGGNIVIHWEGAGQLERADSVNGSYTPINGATSPYSEPISSGARRFFRLVQ